MAFLSGMENCNTNGEGYDILKVAEDAIDQVAVAEITIEKLKGGMLLNSENEFQVYYQLCLFRRHRIDKKFNLIR